MSSVAEAPERRPHTSIRLTRSVSIRLGVVSTATFFCVIGLLGVVLEAITGTALEPITVTARSPLELLFGPILVIFLLVLVVVPHELLHGLFMARYGAKPTYGVGVSRFLLPYAYAGSSKSTYTRNQLLVILLAPFVVITVVGLGALVVVQSPLLLVPIAANAAGSVGDLWMAALLLRYPANVRVAGVAEGQGRGMAIYGSPAEIPAPRRSLERVLAAFVTGASGTFTLLVLCLFSVVVASIVLGSGDVVLGEPGGRWFFLRHEFEPDDYAISIELGGKLLLALSAVGGVAWTFGAPIRRTVFSDHATGRGEP